MYINKLDNISKPKLLQGNKEIQSIKDMVKNKIYTIKFIDGEYNLKL